MMFAEALALDERSANTPGDREGEAVEFHSVHIWARYGSTSTYNRFVAEPPGKVKIRNLP